MKRLYNSDKIKELCDDYFNLDIATRDRGRNYIYIRMVYYQLCLKHASDFSYSKLGRVMNRTHATILWAMGNWNDYSRQRWFSEYREAYNKLSARIGAYKRAALLDSVYCKEVKFEIIN